MNNTEESSIPLTPIPWFAEPYRLFFPLGMGVAILAALLWPLWTYWPDLGFSYPLQAHRYLMLEIYLGAFAMGFLGTAGPRMLDARPFAIQETGTAWLVLLIAGIAHIAGYEKWGHTLFGLVWLSWGLFLILRWRKRGDLPPPGVALVGLTWISGWVSALGIAGVHWGLFPPQGMTYFIVLLQKVFPVGMILGVGAFLLPRFWTAQSLHAFPEMMKPDARWGHEFRWALSTAFLILFGALTQAEGARFWGGILLAAASTVYVFYKIRPFPKSCICTPLGWMARLSLVGLLLGLWLEPLVRLLPNYGRSWELSATHVYLLAGMAMIIFTVSCRVIFGHSGQMKRIRGSQSLVTILISGLLFTLLIRLGAELLPGQKNLLLFISSLSWVATHLIWAIKVLPGIFIVEPD